MVVLLSVLLLLPALDAVSAFVPPPSTSSSSFNVAAVLARRSNNNICHSFSSKSLLHMIQIPGLGKVGGGSDKQKDAAGTLPRDVKEAVSACREAVQEALKNRQSRMEIEFPVGAKFGVEQVPKKSHKKGKKKALQAMEGEEDAKENDDDDDDSRRLTPQAVERSHRELARLFVDMFQPVGGNAITVAFTSEASAEKARKKWSADETAQCQVTSLESNRRQKLANKKEQKKQNNKKKKKSGFAAKLAAEMDSNDDDDGQSSFSAPSGPFQLPSDCEVALFVAPATVAEFQTIQRVCNQVGMGTLVILLNASASNRPPVEQEQHQDFETVYHLSAASASTPGCLLYRKYPSDWILARKPKVGQAQVLATSSQRFSLQQCEEQYASLNLSPVEKGMEQIMDNVAAWF